jgi:hypothetical protein
VLYLADPRSFPSQSSSNMPNMNVKMLLTLVSFSFLVFSPLVESFCYWIDGLEATSNSPCYSLNSVGASMCCDAPDGFGCIAPGICKSTPNGPVGPHDNGSSYWRAACSDNTWQDPACLAMAPCKPS